MATTVASVRVIEGRDVPPAGRYTIDPLHSQVAFSARHMMIARVRGHFKVFGGEIDIAEVPEQSSVAVEIDAASIDTRDPQRDAHLRSRDFLDVERFPKITFESTGVRRAAAPTEWTVLGNLVIRNVTQPLNLSTEFSGAVSDPYGNLRAAFSARGEIDREEFGITWNQPLEAGGFVVGKTVHVELDVEAIRQQS